MRSSLVAVVVLIIGSVLANPAPKKCNKQHLTDPPVNKAEEPAFYVLNPAVPYPYNYHHDNLAAAQFRKLSNSSDHSGIAF